MAAFQAAVDLGCDWIETDLRLTSDGIPVLLHDATLDRTTNGKGNVGGTRLSHVLRLDAGSWFSREFRGARVPTLEEALEWGRQRCGLNLEIKEEDRVEELIHRLASRFRSHAALDRVLFSSFRGSDLKRLRAALPHARLGWLVSRSTRGLTGLNRSLGLAALHPKEPLVTRRLVKRCRRLGLATHVWVVNRARRIRALEGLGVDGVMTDDPRLFTL
ncbi:MAG: glycerophosphodiester phosphodiesterase [Acidobacteria bacterium]|nr:glycerophosphodiester phosphodiesterase [Acidobacteriota bacterium]